MCGRDRFLAVPVAIAHDTTFGKAAFDRSRIPPSNARTPSPNVQNSYRGDVVFAREPSTAHESFKGMRIANNILSRELSNCSKLSMVAHFPRVDGRTLRRRSRNQTIQLRCVGFPTRMQECPTTLDVLCSSTRGFGNKPCARTFSTNILVAFTLIANVVHLRT